MSDEENNEPYCDVCGHSGTDLRTPVEVCRDCYDTADYAARGESIVATAREVEMATSYDSVVRQLTNDLGEVCAERLILQTRAAELEAELAAMRERYPTAWDKLPGEDE